LVACVFILSVVEVAFLERGGSFVTHNLFDVDANVVADTGATNSHVAVVFVSMILYRFFISFGSVFTFWGWFGELAYDCLFI